MQLEAGLHCWTGNTNTRTSPNYFNCGIKVSQLGLGFVGEAGTGTLTISPAAWNAIVTGGGYYWVVEAQSYDTLDPPTYYWSGAEVIPAGSGMAVTGFKSDATSNALDVTYQILPPATGWPAHGGRVTIPEFSIAVYAVPNGSFSDPRGISNEIASALVNDTQNYLTGTFASNVFTVKLAASQISRSSWTWRRKATTIGWSPTSSSSTTPSPSRARRSASRPRLQTADGDVWVYGGARSPWTAQPRLYERGDDQFGRERRDGPRGNHRRYENPTVNFTQTYTATCFAVYGYTHDGTSTIRGGGMRAATSLVCLGGDGDNVFTGGAGDDWLAVGDGSNTLSDGDGDDTLIAGHGRNIITAGNGNDSVTVGNGSNMIGLGDGNDDLSCGDGDNMVRVGNGNDVLIFGNGSNSVLCGNGNDYIQAGHGNNTIVAGNGNDSVSVDNGNNLISLGDFPTDRVSVGDGDNGIELGDGGVSRSATGTTPCPWTPTARCPALLIDNPNADGDDVFFIDARSLGNSVINVGSGDNELVFTNAGADNPTETGGNPDDFGFASGGTLQYDANDPTTPVQVAMLRAARPTISRWTTEARSACPKTSRPLTISR